MRLLLASWHRAVAGGAESYLRGLIPALAARGHQAAFLHEHPSPEGVGAVDPPGSGIPTWCADELGVEGALSAALEWRPDVAYVHGLGSTALESALIDRCPSVLFAHGYYGTCASGTKRHAFPRVTACTRTFGPGCLLLHYPRRCGGLDPRALARSYGLQSARNAILPRYREVAVASTHMHAEYARAGIAPDRLHLVPLPPADVVPDPARPATRQLSGRILFLGRLIRDKGVDLLIDAVPEAERLLGRPLSLVVAGSGPESERLRAQASARRVNAGFPGWVDGEEKLRLLRDADLIAVPSVWGEPFGLVGIEAGCVGLPAVGFAAGGIPDWLTPGVSGESAPAEPPRASELSAAMVRALRDPAHYQALREGAWETSRRFTMDAHLAALEPVLAAAAR